jgi:hypothetical protein
MDLTPHLETVMEEIAGVEEERDFAAHSQYMTGPACILSCCFCFHFPYYLTFFSYAAFTCSIQSLEDRALLRLGGRGRVAPVWPLMPSQHTSYNLDNLVGSLNGDFMTSTLYHTDANVLLAQCSRGVFY